MSNCHSFSVNRLVRSLMGEEYEIKKKRRNSNVRKENGVNLHRALGFEVEGMYERDFRYNGCVYRIYGSPDRLNRREKIVEELKTFTRYENQLLQEMRGIYQLTIYCYLVGYRRARLYLYSVPIGDYVKIIELDIRPRYQIELIKEAIEKIVSRNLK